MILQNHITACVLLTTGICDFIALCIIEPGIASSTVVCYTRSIRVCRTSASAEVTGIMIAIQSWRARWACGLSSWRNGGCWNGWRGGWLRLSDGWLRLSDGWLRLSDGCWNGWHGGCWNGWLSG